MAHIGFGLVGHPLGHSFSQSFFNTIFRERAIDAEYRNFDIADISEIRSIIADNPEICGLNVTIPYKEAVFPYLDDLDDTARTIGAVNVIKVTRESDGKLFLKGYNTDIIGFDIAFCSLLASPLSPRKALVLGTGGASKAAVAWGLIAFSERKGPPGTRFIKKKVMVATAHMVTALHLSLHCPKTWGVKLCPAPKQIMGKPAWGQRQSCRV